AAIALHSHSRHTVWQVRMYAARAAGILGDTVTLERLATDDNDNVREATLPPLRRILGSGAAPHLVAALGRRDYQLLRTAAMEMGRLPASTALTSLLVDALVRVTSERRETSRDVRLAFLERLQEFGVADYVSRLLPLLKDFDPRVAAGVAAVLSASTGATYAIDPQPLPRQPLPTAAEMAYLREFNPVLVMATGGDIELSLDVDRAPMASARFLRLAKAHHFDGLTFHRVVPDFVIQGGSPGANEYMGDGPYLRDEVSTRTHGAGTMGISTRGRDTGDAQIFLNLVDNPRLDFEYTVFGNVERRSLDRMRDVVEGDIITNVRFVSRRPVPTRRSSQRRD
ncbi:MAG TPA: peptidylprolyl isomerase, partial [Gemmatimonadaceae bacterium]|nr:peptidylprolyl isomerase [Gemmatimonadaceae bacterium]